MKKILALFMLICMFTTLGIVAKADYYSGYTTLKYGIRNAEVKNLQNDLKSLDSSVTHQQAILESQQENLLKTINAKTVYLRIELWVMLQLVRLR